MSTRNYFLTGVTEIIILKLLTVRDSYVYELCKEIQEYSDNLLTISQNTVYSATYKLLNDGYISEYSKLVGKRRTRIYYHIEDKGMTHLAQIEQDYFRVTNSMQNIYSFISNSEKEI